MISNIDKLTESGCAVDKRHKVCRSRGGESCAFDGAMIVLQPIADTAHIVHGPIACCGNSWEGRGALSNRGDLHKMGFTTDMNELDIVYGSEEKLYGTIVRTCEAVKPQAVFVYVTCVSGLIGEDIDAVCKRAEAALGVRVIPVNAPGFAGPKNLGNRIAGEVLLDAVIGTGEPAATTDFDVNLIGEYNIAGDLWLVEPVLRAAGIRVLSRITGNAAFEEITYAHRAKLNVIVCSRALINVAKEMKRRYGIPYVEVSFFGKTEMSKALRLVASHLGLTEGVEAVIAREERLLEQKLKPFGHLRGKRAVLYTGGVKSWSFISALGDLGIEVVAIGTKKSTYEDEEKMRELMGPGTILVEDVTPKNLLKLMKERKADILIAGGRNQYLAIKEGFPFVDVNQERHTAYAGYDGLVALAEQISGSIEFYGRQSGTSAPNQATAEIKKHTRDKMDSGAINPLKHSQTIGAAIALQGIDRALPVIHGAQGCTFLAKVLLTKHFREPIALAGTRLFTENIVMGGEESIVGALESLIEKQAPAVLGILSSGLSEVKGDDIEAAARHLKMAGSTSRVIPVAAPDYKGGLETGYAAAVEALTHLAEGRRRGTGAAKGLVNVLAGPHLTPADFFELREMVESSGLCPIVVPDLSALDGSRQGFSGLAMGGTRLDEIEAMGAAEFTLAVGPSMGPAARILRERFGIEYKVLEGISGLAGTDTLMQTLSMLTGKTMPGRYVRQRRILIDGMRDAHSYFVGRKVCLALDPDLSVQSSRWITEMGAEVMLAVIPHHSEAGGLIQARGVTVGDLYSVPPECDLLITNSHGEDFARSRGIPLYQMGFPLHKVVGGTGRVTIGYRGTLALISDAANIISGSH